MDEFFADQFHGDDDIFWIENEALPVSRSAFVPYANNNRPMIQFGQESNNNAAAGNNNNVSAASTTTSLNANKKMIQFWRKVHSAKMESPEYNNRERGHRHMMNERTRREREKQNYLALHSMLPPGTKNDKNSIVKAAAKRIQELQCCKQELEGKYYELEMNLRKNGGGDGEGKKIRVNLENPTSGVDSMLEVLKCLKNLGTKTRSIQTKFSDQKLTAVLDIETQMEAGEVEKAVERILQEVEKRLLRHFQEG